MTRSSLARLERLHARYHTDPNHACRVCVIVWRWLEKLPAEA